MNSILEDKMDLKEELMKLLQPGFIYDFELIDLSRKIIDNTYSIPRLFRFSNVDYYNIRGLETQSLFLSPIGTMNDVFEGLSCEITDKVIDGLDKISNLAYIKSFSEDRDNLLMWAHYADNYSGMCVEYDFSGLDERLLYHLFPVVYSNVRNTSANLEYAIQEITKLKRENENNNSVTDEDYYFLKDILCLFLSKSSVWEYEKEWRIIATYPQIFNEAEDMNDEEYEILYKIYSQKISVKNCIKAVYLGPKMKEEFREHIKEICKDKLNGVRLYSSRLSAKEYKLEYKEIT